MLLVLLLPALTPAAQGSAPDTEVTTPTGTQGSIGGAPAEVAGLPRQESASGLAWYVLHPGTGPAAQPGDALVLHYTGWLVDGTRVDSSRDRRRPFHFTLGGGEVIKGWDEGVIGMKRGEVRQLRIPPSLGYGASGAGGVIPPDAELVFEVELLRIRYPD